MFEQTEKTKAVVSISEMARMVGLSRSRFHQLIGTTFPWPLYDVKSRRPFYTENFRSLPRSPSSQLWHRRQAGAVLRAATESRFLSGNRTNRNHRSTTIPICSMDSKVWA